MTENENWDLRGVLSQVNSLQAQIVDAFASNNLTDNRLREMLRNSQHISERIERFRKSED